MSIWHENFDAALGSHWRQVAAGSGRLALAPGRLRLVNDATADRQYSNAQLDDYQGDSRDRFRWRPPLRLTVRARFSHTQPPGTAGFGFWNEPFTRKLDRLPTPPRALWFFYASPPSDMRLALDTPGRGWKAAVFDANRPAFWLLAPFAPLGFALMRFPFLYRRLWPLGQRSIGVAEAMIDIDKTTWHTYQIDWGLRCVRFWVDDKIVLDNAPSPRGPLGLVIWLDNQTMVVTPQGRFGSGLLAESEGRWLELESICIESP